MSETEPSIAHDPSATAAALGSEQPIYVGSLGFLDSVLSVSEEKVVVAQRAREIAAQANETEDPPVVGTVIGELARLIDPGPGADEALTTEQKDAIADNIAHLVRIHELAEEADDDESRGNVIRQLHKVYFAHDEVLGVSQAGHCLHGAGNQYASQVNFDPDVAWEIFKEEQDEALQLPRSY